MPSLRSTLCAITASTFALATAGCSTTEEPPDTQADAAVEPDSGTTPTPAGSTPPPDGSVKPTDAGPDAAKECTKDEDCPSKVCDTAKGACLAPTCKDGALNQDETDTDCGGANCAPCDVQKKCKGATDCTTKVCTGGVCQAATCTDTVENAVETDVDCGGTTCGKCVDGKKCKVRGDCTSDVCTGGKCAVPSCNDGAKNGTDTDVDCGGPACPRCGSNLMCLTAADCASGVCADTGTGLRCQPPTCMDGIKNQDESDTDCGGATCNGCGVGQACMTGSDCASMGCNGSKVCVAGRSCVTHYGGDTCGLGGEGGVGAAQWEDCCTTAPVTAAGKTVQLDKYPVTAGRMRVFLESVGYDIRGFVQGARAAGKVPLIPGQAVRTVLEPDWDMYLPTSFNGTNGGGELAGCAQKDCLPANDPFNCTCTPGTEFSGIYSAVSRHLGGFIFNHNAQTFTGCFVGGPGTHAFRFPNGQQDGAPPDQGQDLYDTKAMNCVDYLVGQAFCVWDGGRLESTPEWQAAYGPTTSYLYPWIDSDPRRPAEPSDRGLTSGDKTYWGCRFPWATDASHPACGLTWDTNLVTIENAAYKYSYEYPKLLNNDYIVFISAPGRTKGRSLSGHSDMVGNVFELTSTVTYNADPFAARNRWSGNGSWEVHSYNRSGGTNTMLLNKYGKLGLRCVHP
jgi:formylglycine-generating enzyme required for sulfatase activity